MATKPKTRSKKTSTKPPTAATEGPTKDNLLPKAKVLSAFDPVGDTISVCPTYDGGVWTCYDCSGIVTLRNNKREIQQEIEHGVYIRDISISPTNQKLWACCLKDKCVMELDSGKFEVKFHTDKQPWCLCVTHAGHVLVGMEQKLVKFTTDGQIAMSSEKLSTGDKTLVCFPSKVTECAVSHNIAIAERDKPEKGGEDEPHVLVMDEDFREIYRFRGDVPGKEPDSFSPFDVAFDKFGNLLISDLDNNCIHLLSDRGAFLRVVYSSKSDVRAVSVDNDNVLWAVFGSFGSQKVKVLKYSSQ